MMPMILTVYLSDGEQAATEVPITPETTCRDVVEFCKEPGESGCHLAEVWRGNERAIPFEHMMYEHLQKWGPRKQEVKFFLRHEDSPTESSDQGSQQSQDQTSRRSGNTGEKHSENGVGNQRVELTLSELQEMATRQQQQIEAQQQMLVAKEQRLRYLKQQERRQQQTVSESEKLQKLKERVESQEAKLKKIRAMRGQVDYSKVINAAEIEQVSGLFQEKQAELQSAVLRVEQLSLQLEDLRRGKLNGIQTALGSQVTGAAALELRKLYQELQIRNKLNQEQNSKLKQQKELLNKRNMEVTLMDKRISELRERLYKKKAEARQKENLPLNRANGPPSPQPAPGTLGRVAAVGPYIQVPVPGRQEGGYTIPADPLKPQTLGVNNQANHGRTKSANDTGWPTLGKTNTSLKPPERRDSGSDTQGKSPPSGSPITPSAEKVLDSKMAMSSPAISKPQPPPYGSHLISANSASSLDRRKDVPPPRPLPNPPAPAWPRVPASTGSSSQQIQQRISVPPSPTFQPNVPLFPPGLSERLDPPPAVAVRPFIPDRGSRPQSPRKGPPTMNSSSIYHMYLQQAAPKSQPLKPALKAVYGKPVLHPSSTPPSPLPFVQAGGAFPLLQGHLGGEDTMDGEFDDHEFFQHPEPLAPPPSVENIPRPLSPTKLTPMVHSPLRYQSDADLEVLRKKLANAPRPLKKRSSITEPEGPSGPNIQKLLYQRFNTLAGGIEGNGVSGSAGGNGAGNGTPFYQPANPPAYLGGDSVADTDNGNLTTETPLPPPEAEELGFEGPPTSTEANDNESLPSPPELDPAEAEEAEDDNNNNMGGSEASLPSPVLEVTTPEESGSLVSQHLDKRTNLKKPNSERIGHGFRVKFNPLALLLDASLEGEFDLVQRIIYEVCHDCVENPSTANDEGITPLHNAVCAGHHHIVKFLLDFGVNVNAADSDGWTPLHCAASCNSVHLCKLLVESGAAIFASTISDVETAADKCEEMEEGYIQCSQFLYGVQEKMGVMNKGTVYALWDYKVQNQDELPFSEGDAITILRRQDDSETEWWWAQLEDNEGYVPRNLLGLYPRIKPRQRSLA
ncbi:protein phosphatase 1, regulatory subunit 13Bb isoform X2 [Anoplopoma fimbria]|uniref:protein phosphatase 1, regulatory subunit 13Bb isoform X2 n=1 Tax=Anoplopoma fimbria TaxID=229290 RepID=UPI0023EBAAA4|nr:protein phosphatase 1, regulatory subunit 13Bb isoform X2 [Anoplopoma fimbria]